MPERFWPKVQQTDGCWLWLGAKDQKGYGAFSVATSRRKAAHRIAWELTRGPLSVGVCVLHRCDNPACVRPDHLFLGTVADNNADMHGKGRAWWQNYPNESQREKRRQANAARKKFTVHCQHCGKAIQSAQPTLVKWCSGRCETRVRRARAKAAA